MTKKIHEVHYFWGTNLGHEFQILPILLVQGQRLGRVSEIVAREAPQTMM